jgi:ribonuclease E
MDHETDTAAPEQAPEVDERIAAFKRGAPLPKPAAEKPQPAVQQKIEPAVPVSVPERAEGSADRGHASDRSIASGDDGSPSRARRRRRGGRGRGGRGAGAGGASAQAATSTEPHTVDVNPDDASTTDPATAPSGESGSPAGGTAGSGGAPRRRRRGGRGRGTGGTGRAAVAEPEGLETSPEPQSADSQRDDAAPDARASHSRSSRRSGSRGSGAKSGGQADDGQATTERKPRQMTAEEQIASGGPTRSIRGSRTRTGGRSGRDGRRRREPTILPPRITDKLMVITERGERDQIAVLEEDVLVQHYVTRQGATSMVGNVFLGRVQNVLPGMEAAFVDIGRGRNGVLYAGEVNYRPEDLEGPAPRIENVLKPGQAVMVQITKDPMGGKGARLTAQISLPGRYLVFAPDQDLSGISRRLPDNERKRLKAILRKVQPSGHGVIVRTAAEGAAEEAFVHDMKRLIGLWDDIQKQAKRVKAPSVLYEEPELTLRVFRDLFTDEEFKGLVTDSPRIHEQVLSYVRDIAPDLEAKVSLHRGKLPAFEEHRIEEQILKTLDRKVWLPSGGYLIIERTEAMTIVDVNTGKSVGKTNLEETVVNTNLEAAKEVARQLRLRDIGGIIVVDFIDMLLDKNKGKVEETMKEAMALDKTRSQVFEIGPLGLMQVTRKRVSSGLVESFSETCPTCEGRGILINYES